MPIKGLNQAASLQAKASLQRLKFNVVGGAVGCGLMSSSAVRKYPIGLINARLAAQPVDPQGQGGQYFLCEETLGIYNIIKQDFLKN